MKRLQRTLSLLGAALLTLLTISLEAAPKNILLLCIDDLRPELACFGASYIHSPNIDALAKEGRPFFNHYVNAPSCGPSRFTLLTGRYGGPSNGALFERAKHYAKNPEAVAPSMPEWFREHGYTTVSVGKVSHHPGGRGGRDWNDDRNIEIPKAWDRHLMPVGDWQHPRGAMHGLAHGETRGKANEMDLFQAVEGQDDIYPDGLTVDEALTQLDTLTANANTPFFLAVGLLKPHLPFGAPQKYLDLYDGVELPPIPHPEKPKGKSTWHSSGEFMKYNRWGKDPRSDDSFATEVRRHYAACVSYADAQVGRILERLQKTGADKNTIVVLWGDHGWNLGEHNIWGKHNLFEEGLHAPLIIAYPGLRHKGQAAQGVVASLDLFPTLCALSGLPVPDFAQGESLLPLLENPSAPGHVAVAYNGKAKTLRNASHRLIVHRGGEIELYDHRSQEKETRNVAEEQPEVLAELLALLEKQPLQL